MTSQLKWIGAILGVLFFLVFFGYLALLGHGIKNATKPEVSLKAYEAIVSKRASQSARYRFLPSSIPVDRATTAFYHIPRFLQGPDVICLRQKLSGEVIKGILEDLESSGRTEIKNLEEISAQRCYLKFGIETPSKRGLWDDAEELPESFRIFLFETDPEDIKKNWNHNFLAFTAVSLELGEVVYHTDYW